MRKTTLPLLFVASAVAAFAFSASRDAHALGPLSIEVAAKGGFATNPDGSNNQVNPLGGTIGGRAGVSILSFYGGIDGEYFFGGTEDNVTFHTVKYGVQLGYNLGIPLITVRPQVGLGNLTISASAPGVSGIPDHSSFYAEPGVTALIAFGLFFVGADANALLITTYPQSDGTNGFKAAFTAHGQVGVTF